MVADLLRDARFWLMLLEFDEVLAAACRAEGCPFCGGPLCDGRYGRKPRGGPAAMPAACGMRFSLCCGREGCRRRTLPGSCLYMGARVYLAGVILVAVMLAQGRTDGKAVEKVMSMSGADRRTVRRWIAYFRVQFPASPGWQRLRGRVSASVYDRGLPGSLIEQFLAAAPTEQEGLAACLHFLSGAWTG
jgi:hypothetical protein